MSCYSGICRWGKECSQLIVGQLPIKYKDNFHCVQRVKNDKKNENRVDNLVWNSEYVGPHVHSQ